MQGCRAGAHGYGMLGANVSGKFLFEPFDFWSGGEPTGTKAINDFRDLILTDERKAVRKNRVAH
jgi:hypothetical protein